MQVGERALVCVIKVRKPSKIMNYLIFVLNAEFRRARPSLYVLFQTFFVLL
jgi:hypothetical protein